MTEAIKKDDYARLHYAYHEDTDLAMIADQLDEQHAAGWLVWLYWPRMVARAKQAKSFGWFETTPRKLAASLHDPIDGAWQARRTMWEMLAAEDIIRLRQQRVESASLKLDVLLVEYEKWQSLSNAEHSRLKRERVKHDAGEPVHWTLRHWSEFAFTPIQSGMRDNEIGGRDTKSVSHPHGIVSHPPENTSRDRTLDKTRRDETTEDVCATAAPAAPTPLPTVVKEACDAAGVTGVRPEWWISSIQKLRHRNPTAPDDVFVNAIDWVVVEVNGNVINGTRAWSMLQGAVTSRIRRHDKLSQFQAAATKPRRSAAELIAAQDAVWNDGSDA